MKNIRDLLSRLESAIVDELERLNERVYALEENRKLKDARILQLTQELQDLRMAVNGKVKFDALA